METLILIMVWLRRSCAREMIGVVLMGVMLVGAGGCKSQNADPFEKVNRGMYKFNDGLDKFVLKPLAGGYDKVVPRAVRTGIGNVFDNLGYGNVIVNDLLQGKFGEALGGVGRVAVNTTVGVAGAFDVATGWGLEARSNDFGITLGKWGAGPGPYLVLPVFGPSSGRDLPGIVVRRAVHPLTYVDLSAAVSIPISATQVVDARSRAAGAIQFRDEAAIDPYVFTREAYLKRREVLIREGKPAATQPTEGEDFYDVEEQWERRDPAPTVIP